MLRLYYTDFYLIGHPSIGRLQLVIYYISQNALGKTHRTTCWLTMVIISMSYSLLQMQHFLWLHILVCLSYFKMCIFVSCALKHIIFPV